MKLTTDEVIAVAEVMHGWRGPGMREVIEMIEELIAERAKLGEKEFTVLCEIILAITSASGGGYIQGVGSRRNGLTHLFNKRDSIGAERLDRLVTLVDGLRPKLWNLLAVFPAEERSVSPYEGQPPTLLTHPDGVVDILATRVATIGFSGRTLNCLANANCTFVYEVVRKTEREILKTKNFGRKSLKEVREWLTDRGFSFGMKLTDEDTEEIRRHIATAQP